MLINSTKKWTITVEKFATQLRGNTKSGKGVKVSVIGKSLQAASGEMRDKVQQVASGLDHKRWWTKGYPKFWQYRYYGTSPCTWLKQKRPTGRLKAGGRVKLTRKSSVNDIMTVVYIKFRKGDRGSKGDRWARNNVWYARFVEGGTGPGKKGKRPELHRPTKAKTFFAQGIAESMLDAENTVITRIESFFNSFPF